MDKIYNKTYLKSSYELERAQFLDSISKYEEITYKLDGTTYTPDFFIYDENDNLIRIEEVKSIYTYENSKVKIANFLRLYEKESKIYHILFKEDLNCIINNKSQQLTF